MNGLCIEDLSVGQAAELTRRVRAGDLDAFAAVTGDNNPVHLDEAQAPLRIGDAVTARAEIIVLDEPRAGVTLKTTCLVNGKATVEGEAEVRVPRRGARAAR